MSNYIVVSIISGILFAMLDGLINANSVAISLFEVYRPIAKTSVNVVAGLIIDLVYGFALAALFLLLYPGLPGEAGLVKGLVFALIIWFLRVAMNVASQWMMFNMPFKVLLYILLTGLGQMLILGVLYGLALQVAI